MFGNAFGSQSSPVNLHGIELSFLKGAWCSSFAVFFGLFFSGAVEASPPISGTPTAPSCSSAGFDLARRYCCCKPRHIGFAVAENLLAEGVFSEATTLAPPRGVSKPIAFLCRNANPWESPTAPLNPATSASSLNAAGALCRCDPATANRYCDGPTPTPTPSPTPTRTPTPTPTSTPTPTPTPIVTLSPSPEPEVTVTPPPVVTIDPGNDQSPNCEISGRVPTPLPRPALRLTERRLRAWSDVGNRSDIESSAEPERSAVEEWGAWGGPGRVVMVGRYDSNYNGLPDFLDGIEGIESLDRIRQQNGIPRSSTSRHFVMIEVEIEGGAPAAYYVPDRMAPGGERIESPSLRIDYSGSPLLPDPIGCPFFRGLQAAWGSSGVTWGGYDERVASTLADCGLSSGGWLVWTKNGQYLRDARSVPAGGDYVPSGIEIPLHNLDTSGNRVRFYVEATPLGELARDFDITLRYGRVISGDTLPRESVSHERVSLLPVDLIYQDARTHGPIWVSPEDGSRDPEGEVRLALDRTFAPRLPALSPSWSAIDADSGAFLVQGALTDGASLISIALQERLEGRYQGGGNPLRRYATWADDNGNQHCYTPFEDNVFLGIRRKGGPLQGEEQPANLPNVYGGFHPPIGPHGELNLLPRMPMPSDSATAEEWGYSTRINLGSGIRPQRYPVLNAIGGYYLPPNNFISGLAPGDNDSRYGGGSIVLERSVNQPEEVAPMEVVLYRRVGSRVVVLEVQPFYLRRPPVVLVHGMNGDGRDYWPWDLWAERNPTHLDGLPTRIYRADYSFSAGLGYTENFTAVPKAIQQALVEYRWAYDNTFVPPPDATGPVEPPFDPPAVMPHPSFGFYGDSHRVYAWHRPERAFKGINYAATRVDVVAHSMGGQLVRTYVSNLGDNTGMTGVTRAHPDTRRKPRGAVDFSMPAALIPGTGVPGIPARFQNLRLQIPPRIDRSGDSWTFWYAADLEASRLQIPKYQRSFNYGTGDIRRFIPIGSPFKGAPAAWITERAYSPSQRTFWNTILSQYGGSSAAAQWLKDNNLVDRRSSFPLYPTCHADLVPGSRIQSLLEEENRYPEGRYSVSWSPIVGQAMRHHAIELSRLGMSAFVVERCDPFCVQPWEVAWQQLMTSIYGTPDISESWYPNGTHDDMVVPGFSQRNAGIGSRLVRTYEYGDYEDQGGRRIIVDEWDTIFPQVSADSEWITGSREYPNSGLGTTVVELPHSRSRVMQLRLLSDLQQILGLESMFSSDLLEAQNGGRFTPNGWDYRESSLLRMVLETLRGAEGLPTNVADSSAGPAGMSRNSLGR